MAVVIFVIAGLLAPGAAVGAWASRTIADTDRYVSTVAPLLDSQQVREAISTKVTDALFANVPIDQLLAETLPPKAAALSGPISSGLRSFVQSKVNEALATPEARQAWATINAELQSRLIAVLKGDNSGAVSIQGDAIVLDTGVLFERVQTLLVQQGFTIFAKVPLPAVADRQLVLLKSSQVKTVSATYRIVEPLANSLIVVVVLLLIAGIFVSRSRRYGVFAASWILLLTGAAVIALVTIVRAVFLADLGVPDASWQAVTFDTITRFMSGLGRTALALGLVGLVGGIIAGPAKPAVALRSGVLRFADLIAAPLVSMVPAVGKVGRVVRPSAWVFGGAIIVIGAFSLVASRSASAGRIAWIVVIGLVAWFIVLVVAATGGAAAEIDEPTAQDELTADAGN